MALPATASLPQSGSIVARWKLDEASGTRNDSVGTSHLTDNNTVASAAAQFGVNGADFELSNSEYLNVADNATLSIVGNQTHAFWLNVESQPGTDVQYYVEGKYTPSQRTFIFTYEDESGTKKMRLYLSQNVGGGDISRTVTQTLTNGVWYHIAWVFSTAGEVKFYVNGVQVGSTQTGYDADVTDGTADYTLGIAAPGTYTNFYDGMMQDAMIWNVSLSGAEVLSLYNAYFPLVLPKSLQVMQAIKRSFSY